MGDYALDIRTYVDAAAVAARKRHYHQFRTMLTYLWLPDLVMVPMEKLITRAFTSADARLFAVAIEDVSNSLVYAESLARTGKTEEARAMLDTMLALPEIHAMGSLYWATLYQRGLIARQQGKRDEAILFLTQSVAAIENVRSTIAFEAAKIGFAGDKQAVYAALVAALADKGDWNEAFLIAERAKARSLVDLLAQRRDLGPPPSADDRVRELFASAATVDAGAGLPESEAAVRGITLIAESRTALASSAPEAASLVSVQQVSIADIAARMAPGEALIDYYGSGDDLYALVLNGTTVRGFRLAGQGLANEVRAYRDAIERRDPGAAALGRPLYDRLIRPVAGQLTGSKLTISPNGVLHYLPFAALMDGDQYLLDRFSLRLIPSAGTLAYLRTDHPTKIGRLLALGNPDLGNSAYDLPNAQIEAVNVAALFPDSRALVRSGASKSAIRELGNGFSMLHFATHGKFNADAPLDSGLYLAKGSEADGVLTVGDLYSLRFDADLVTLSACETGLGKVANGDDVIGLTRGFLYAGARSIVASLWEVDDAATEQLMLSFYRNLDGHDKREALRLAQIETRSSFPQPMYWAAFQIIGRAD
jgi:CHAT domain-containing protein